MFCTIVIIDSSSYQLVTIIKNNHYYSSLCVFNEHSFIYANFGTFIQILNEYSVLFQSEKGFGGYFGIIPLKGWRYFAIENAKKINIVKSCFD